MVVHALTVPRRSNLEYLAERDRFVAPTLIARETEVGCCILAALMIGSGFKAVNWLRPVLFGRSAGGELTGSPCGSSRFACRHRDARHIRGLLAVTSVAVVTACVVLVLHDGGHAIHANATRAVTARTESVAALVMQSICGKRQLSIAKAD